MNYKNLFKSTDVTHVGLIGTCAFGRSFLTQSRLTPGIKVPVVCDQDLETAGKACLQAGLAPEDMKVCHTESEANDVIASGKTAVVSDARLLMNLPIEVVVEASGMPGAGALHGLSAIENGKHVVMVTKETDCVVGPILNRSLKHTVEKGRLLTYGMIEHDPESCLWKLRREQEELFEMPDRI